MDNIKIQEGSVTETAQTVATSIAQAAKPGPVPTATGTSPIDGAAASVASAVVGHVASSSAQLAPRSAEGLAKSEAALSQMRTQDDTSAADIKVVPTGMQAHPQTGGTGGVQPLGGDPWEEWENFRDGSEPLPIGPPGAGPGPSVIPGTGVPDESI
jgi:hypothetical protein